MTDALPPGPAPIPPPDRHQLERLNALYDPFETGTRPGWKNRIGDRFRGFLARILFRQREFNAALVDHVNRSDIVQSQAHEASGRTIAWVQTFVETLRTESTDSLERHQHALAAWEVRSRKAVEALAASHEELRTSIGVLQQATQNLKREMARIGEGARPATAAVSVATHAGSAVPSSQLDALDSHTYVGFEDQFRGSTVEIRARLAEYVPIFEGTQDVLDVGCGRGEFLTLLRDRGIRARGIDVNAAMVEVCRQQGLDVAEADALSYLHAQPDGSLGGLISAQVVEHLEPRYLVAFLNAAFTKLRPGAPIVLETINPACWFAFFESYVRDITHVRPLHPDTLKYLMVASGFQRVDITYRSPYPEHEKLQPIPATPSLGESVDTLNANVERINRLLFTWLDYAAVGRRA